MKNKTNRTNKKHIAKTSKKMLLFSLTVATLLLLPTILVDAGPSKPSVYTKDATKITTISAQLNGYLKKLNEKGPGEVWFEYGTSTDYGYATKHQPISKSGSFSSVVSGLTSRVTYHFRAVASNSNGISYGKDKTFILRSLPLVTTNDATNIQRTGATLHGCLADMGGMKPCEIWFEYGLSTNYGKTTSHLLKSSPDVFSFKISGLTSGTTYHFRAVASNGVGASYGQDKTFTTS